MFWGSNIKGLQGLSILLALFCKTDHFCKRTTGWSDTEQWRLNVSCFTNIHVFFCFSSFSLSLDYRITQAIVIAEFLEGKRLKLLHSKCTQCRLLVRSIFQHQFNLCWSRNTKRIWLRITINSFCSLCLLIVKFEGQSINLIMKLMASVPGDTFFDRKR